MYTWAQKSEAPPTPHTHKRLPCGIDITPPSLYLPANRHVRGGGRHAQRAGGRRRPGPHTRMVSETPLLLQISLIKAARAWQRPVCPPRGEASAGATARAWPEPLLRADRTAPSCRSYRSGAGLDAREQAAAHAVLARGIAAFLLAFLNLDAVGVCVRLVRRRRRRGCCGW